MQIGCLRRLNDFDALYAFMSVMRSKLNYTDLTLNNNDNNNNEDHQQQQHLLGFVSLRIALYTIAMVASLVGNVLVILIVVCNRFMHKSTNYFVLNLAVCNLAIVFSCMWVQIVSSVNRDWTLGSLFMQRGTFWRACSHLWPSLVAALWPSCIRSKRTCPDDRLFCAFCPSGR